MPRGVVFWGTSTHLNLKELKITLCLRHDRPSAKFPRWIWINCAKSDFFSECRDTSQAVAIQKERSISGTEEYLKRTEIGAGTSNWLPVNQDQFKELPKDLQFMPFTSSRFLEHIISLFSRSYSFNVVSGTFSWYYSDSIMLLRPFSSLLPTHILQKK